MTVSSVLLIPSASLSLADTWPVILFHAIALSLLAWTAWRLHRVHCRRANRELGDQRMVAIGNLAAGMAHEIRNPLNTISLTCRYLERLLDKAELQAPLRSDLTRNFEVISSEVSRLTQALDSFVLLARPTDIHPVAVDLDSVVDDALTHIRRELDAAHVELVRTHEAPARVAADPDRLGQVFASIARNAIQAMPDGGRLSVATRLNDESARVEFSDTGQGIAENDVPHVFEPYFTTKRSGLGFGLALSLKTVTAHGGSIEVSSPPCSGATFTVVLPCETVHA